MTAIERFWTKVERRGPDECWPWNAGRVGGYGRFRVDLVRVVNAQVFAWELAHGPVPRGGVICHRCDNPPCCNEAHLFLGTHAVNNADMVNKGRDRRARGREYARTVLSEDDVREIRARRAAGASVSDLARAFGVADGTAWAVLVGRSWTWLR